MTYTYEQTRDWKETQFWDDAAREKACEILQNEGIRYRIIGRYIQADCSLDFLRGVKLGLTYEQ